MESKNAPNNKSTYFHNLEKSQQIVDQLMQILSEDGDFLMEKMCFNHD